MTESGDRLRALLRGFAEPLLALVGAFLVTALLTLPFLPMRLQLDIALRPEAGGEALPYEQLEREVAQMREQQEKAAHEQRAALAGGQDHRHAGAREHHPVGR